MAEVQYPPESEMGKEYLKWNKPYVFQMFPKMLYRAQRLPNGKYSAGEGDDRALGGALGSAEQFTRGCQIVAKDETEYKRYLNDGWRDTPPEALEFAELREDRRAKEAAHRAHDDRNMSDKAQESIKAAEAANFEVVPEIPEAPRVKRKYQRKAV